LIQALVRDSEENRLLESREDDVVPCVLVDAALYPLAGVGSAALALWGTRARRPWAVFLAGAALSLGVFVSFGLLPLVPLVA